MTLDKPLTREGFIGILFGAGAFQMLHAGCELGLFTLLERQPGLTAEDIADRLGLQSRPAHILLLGATALRLTTCDAGKYRNGDLLEGLFREGIWPIIEDIIAFQDQITAPAALDFVESLRRNTNVG